MDVPQDQPANDRALRVRTRRFLILGVVLLIVGTPLQLGLSLLDVTLGFPVFAYLVSPALEGIATALLAAGFVGVLLRSGG
jgi:hypothetical protein